MLINDLGPIINTWTLEGSEKYVDGFSIGLPCLSTRKYWFVRRRAIAITKASIDKARAHGLDKPIPITYIY
ncbi:hypothetical protein VMUT_0669 [Vulcanisaeta moutnovskia 768-28]|uniref:Uncharacterized protein n=1 Tax=Vulcanisaeta moutnovskia (strain 768-28) TaxID=985053 RepID=F0QVM7_VULM7|nr:hypothetical protein VMUT_0669 [Vulcanisaeta moutnovskia 768-28]